MKETQINAVVFRHGLTRMNTVFSPQSHREFFVSTAINCLQFNAPVLSQVNLLPGCRIEFCGCAFVETKKLHR